MSDKVYLLRKPLPNLSGNEKFMWSDVNNAYTDYKGRYKFTQSEIDENPDWFDLQEPKIYTASDLSRAVMAASKAAFVAAREEKLQLGQIAGGLGPTRDWKYRTFDDYQNAGKPEQVS